MRYLRAGSTAPPSTAEPSAASALPLQRKGAISDSTAGD
eukprot:COSAG06_NODE_52333_length_306_cov_0.917874_1_plen_38_part_01